jgi:uncharacterized protein (DUF1810 family)
MLEVNNRDPYNLERFVTAQGPVYEQVCSELGAGHKDSHWMWFIFPQLEGLAQSSMARYYAISSIDEAKAYLAHPILGRRLEECCRLVNLIKNRSIEEIFEHPDCLKFRSSISLFARATRENEVFTTALAKYFHNEPDFATLERL